MRKLFYIIIINLLIASCNEWFDVKPTSEVKDSEIFSRDVGFYRAVIGAYVGLCDVSLYGKELTYGSIELLSQSFVLGFMPNSKYAPLLDYEYDNYYARFAYEPIFSKAYNIIANINYLLLNIEGKQNMFPEHYYEMIIAEMKAMRAYIHFDLLRLFAPSPSSSNLNTKAIPYAESFKRGGHEQLTLGEILTKIKQDLIEAINLLEVHDPYFYISNASSETISMNDQIKDGGFAYARKTRLNYYAVNALLSRVHLYEGDYQNALNRAKITIESEQFPLGKPSQTSPINSQEIVFYLTDINLLTKSLDIFSEKQGFKFSIPDDFLVSLFEEQIYELTDYRRITQFSSRDLETVNFLNKYFYFGTSTTQTYIPMIRVSEMYYIASEASYKLGNNIDALQYINAVRKERIGKIPENELSLDNFENPEFDFETEIEKEYRKEFLGEGQLFFYYKRLNRTMFKGINGKEVKINDYPSVYVLPIPEREQEYGTINS